MTISLNRSFGFYGLPQSVIAKLRISGGGSNNWLLGSISSSTITGESFTYAGNAICGCFGQTGEYFYLQSNNDNLVQTYQMVIPWDMSTGVLLGSTSVSTTMNGMCFSYDGEYFYRMSSSNNLVQYTLNTPWILADGWSGTVTQNIGATINGSMHITKDGMRLFGINSSSASFHSWEFGTAFDVSTLTNYTTQSNPGGFFSPGGIWFNDEGSQCIVNDLNIRLFDLGTNFDITSISANSSFSSGVAYPNRMLGVEDDGSKIYAGGSTVVSEYSTNLEVYDGSYKPQGTKTTVGAICSASLGGLCYYDGFMYSANSSGSVNKADINDIPGTTTVIFTTGHYARSLTTDGTYFYEGDDGGVVRKYQMDGTFVSTLHTFGSGGLAPHALDYDSQTGLLYCGLLSGAIYTIDPSTGDTVSLGTVNSAVGSTTGCQVIGDWFLYLNYNGTIFAVPKSDVTASPSTYWSLTGLTSITDDFHYVEDTRKMYSAAKTAGVYSHTLTP